MTNLTKQVPAVFLFGEFWFFNVYTRRKWIFALLIFVFVGILIEHSNLSTQGFLQKWYKDTFIFNSLFLADF